MSTDPSAPDPTPQPHDDRPREDAMAPRKSTDDKTSDKADDASRTDLAPHPGFASDLEVVQAPPMFWMVDRAGNLHPAGDHEARMQLESSGCRVTDQVPDGAPAATGGFAI